MTDTTTDRDLDAIAERGEQVYARRIAGTTRPDQADCFVAIDVNSEDFEIDPSDQRAIARLRERQPEAEVYLCRVGLKPAYETRWW